MKSTRKILSYAVAGVACGVGGAHATPNFDAFGDFPQADFDGTDIPTDPTASSSQFLVDYSDADGNQSAIVTVALSATQRFFNAPPTNDGLGTYQVQAGTNGGQPGGGVQPSPTVAAKWNFNYYVSVEGSGGSTPDLNDFDIELLYDFDTGEDTIFGNLGVVDVDLYAPEGLAVAQGSQNLAFDAYENGDPSLPGFITPPAGSFDPNENGEYTFALRVNNKLDTSEIDIVSIKVNVVPEPGSLALAGLGAAAMLVRRRKG